MKVFITYHAYARLKKRAGCLSKLALKNQVSAMLDAGEAYNTPPAWYSRGKANQTDNTLFCNISDTLLAICEPNRKGRGYVVTTLINQN